MTPELRNNLLRLLRPRHIAVVGGTDAETVIGEIRRADFPGALWPVNPRREQLAGVDCFPSLAELPEPPDAAYLAVPQRAVVDVISQLRELGAGGAVCYSAGYGEIGDAGRQIEADLAAAAGDLAIVGPNCYGLINYVDRVALWPFAHSGRYGIQSGAAIITQSGMLSSDLIMAQRSLPLAHIVSAGNQTVLGIEDYIDVFLDLPEVRVIGLHIEGLRNIPRFEAVAARAQQAGIPIVALKLGRSAIGARITANHTDSLAGTDELYDAMFRYYNIIRVHSPTALLETLKYLSVTGTPKGRRLAAFTCSGADATLVADYAAEFGLELPEPPPEVQDALRHLLPPIATPANPLDYTTPLWGHREELLAVFRAAFTTNYDAALLVQDYTLPGLDNSEESYLNDARGFVEAAKATNLPAAVCSTVPENFTESARDWLVSEGVAPLQGVRDAVRAIALAETYAHGNGGAKSLDEHTPEPPRAASRPAAPRALQPLDEATAKLLLREGGIQTPTGVLWSEGDFADVQHEVTFPVAIKVVRPVFEHKTDFGLVALNLTNASAVQDAATAMRDRVTAEVGTPSEPIAFLVESMVPEPVAELLVGVRNDPEFGFAMTLGSGGIYTEIEHDATTVLLPADASQFEHALRGLRVHAKLAGFRNRPPADMARLLATLTTLADLLAARAGELYGIEINPLSVGPDWVCAVDAVIHAAPDQRDAESQSSGAES